MSTLGCHTLDVYGGNCSIPCPENCKDKKCHIQNGTCYVCAAGWKGTLCTASIDFFLRLS